MPCVGFPADREAVAETERAEESMGGTMNTADIKKLNQYFYDEVFRRQHVDAIDELLTDDFVEHIPAPGQAPDRQGAKKFISHMLQAFPDLDYDVKSEIAEGDMLAIVGVMKGTHSGEFLGVPGSGRKANVTVMETSRVRDGKFSDHWGLVDVPTLMQQVGMPSPTR
jgi:steroid delta-isomerase-like uncharacterized protein